MRRFSAAGRSRVGEISLSEMKKDALPVSRLGARMRGNDDTEEVICFALERAPHEVVVVVVKGQRRRQ